MFFRTMSMKPRRRSRRASAGRYGRMFYAVTVIQNLQANRFHIVQLQISHVLITLLPELSVGRVLFSASIAERRSSERIAVLGSGAMLLNFRRDASVQATRQATANVVSFRIILKHIPVRPPLFVQRSLF